LGAHGRFLALLLACLLLAGLVLAGCATRRTEPAPGAPTAPDQPRAGAPQARQVLTLNLGAEPPQLDSALTTDTLSFNILAQVMEGLVRPGEGARIEKGSGQAADWHISADGLTYTFTLKEGLRWSDGQPVTARDFAYAWFRALDPRVASPYNYQLFAIRGARAWATLDTTAPDFAPRYAALRQQVGIETPDDRTIRVRLEAPTPYFLGLTAFPTYLPQRQDLVEKHGPRYAADGDKLVYNGPFQIAAWEHDREVVLARNPQYWDAGMVRLQTVTFKMVANASTALNMYEAGELDAVAIPGTHVAAYRDRPGFHQRALTTTQFLACNLADAQRPWLRNVHIRRALSLALDRQEFVDKVLQGGSQVALGLVPATINMAGASYREQVGPMLPPRADRARAQAELAAGLRELGLTRLPPLDLLIDAGDVPKRLAQGVQGMVQQNLPGVVINIVPLEFKVRLQRMRQGDFDLVFSGWAADYDDPMTFLGLFTSGNPQNDARWANPAYDRLIATAASSQDPQQRLAAFKQAEQLLLAELPILPLYHPAAAGVRQPYVKGLLHFPVGAEFDLKWAYIERPTAGPSPGL
jgi:oligopeptide transport system substrate-binding protein